MSSTHTQEKLIDTESLGGRYWIGILVALVSGVIHLYLGVSFFPSGMGISFLLAGLGFLGAIGLILIDYRRRLVVTIGIPYVIAQIVLWYVLNFAMGPKAFPADVGTIGVIDKIAQVVLLVVLVLILQE